MTTSTIQDTVTAALREQGLSGYGQQAQRVVDALVRREMEIGDKLIEIAEGEDLDPNKVRNFLQDAGMSITPSSSDADNGETGENADRLAAVERQVASLVEFARRNGYRA